MDYFATDWAAMTFKDWIGLIVTVGIFLLMIWAYVYTFSPKNKEKFESQRYLIDDDDDHTEDSKK